MFRWLFFFIFLTCNVALNSQVDNARSRFYVGGGGAAQLALILNQNNYGFAELAYDAKIGFQAGPKIGFEWNNYNQVESGIIWTTLGQRYEDNIRNILNEKVVELQYVYFPVLYKRILGYLDHWSSNVKTGNFYIGAGLQAGRLLSANVTWKKDGQSLTMLDYLLEEGVNINEEQLLALGNPVNDQELFQKFDLMGLGVFGYQRWIGTFTTVSLEMRNGLGLTDNNSKAWRLPNRKEIYEPSRNAFTSLFLAVQVFF